MLLKQASELMHDKLQIIGMNLIAQKKFKGLMQHTIYDI